MNDYQLSDKMPNPELEFKEWMDRLLTYWLGYGGCRAPDVPKKQWMPDVLPRPGSRYDPYQLAQYILDNQHVLRVCRDHKGRVQRGGEISAKLGEGTYLAGVPQVSRHFYRYIRITGECGETVYKYRKYWQRPDQPIYPFPDELVAAIDLGRRTVLFQAAIGDTRPIHMANLSFFSQLHRLLTEHPLN